MEKFSLEHIPGLSYDEVRGMLAYLTGYMAQRVDEDALDMAWANVLGTRDRLASRLSEDPSGS